MIDNDTSPSLNLNFQMLVLRPLAAETGMPNSPLSTCAARLQMTSTMMGRVTDMECRRKKCSSRTDQVDEVIPLQLVLHFFV